MGLEYITKSSKRVWCFVFWRIKRTGHPYAPNNSTWGVKWESPWGKTYQWTKGMGFSSYGSWIDKIPF